MPLSKSPNGRIAFPNKLILAIRNLNRVLHSGTDTDRMLDGACRSLADASDARNVWIATVDGNMRVLRQYHAGSTDGFREAAEKGVQNGLPECAAQALGRTPGVAVVSRPATECGTCPPAAFGSDLGAITARIGHLGKTFGFLHMMSDPEFLSEGEVQNLVLEIADTLGFALAKADAESRLSESESKAGSLRESMHGSAGPNGPAEEAQSKTREQLQAIIDHTPALVYVKDLDGRLTLVNRRFESAFGLPHDAILGKTSHDLFPKDIADSHRSNDLRIMAEKKPETGEELNDEKDGRHTYLSTRFPMFDSKGEMYAVCGISTDITERKRAEEQLQILRLSIENAPDGAFSFDGEGRILYVNGAGCGALGYAREELLRMRVGDINPPATPERWAWAVGELKKKGKFSIQTVFRRKDGSEFPAEINSWYFKIEDREFYNGFARDITERKLAEDALRESENRHRTIIQTAMDGFWLIDLRGRILQANEAYGRMSGYSLKELTSMEIADLEAAENRAEIADRARRIAAEGRARFETRHRKKDGTLFDVEVSTHYLPIEDGRIVSFFRDITERKKLHEQAADALDFLQAVLEKSPVGIFTCRANGDVVSVNPALVQIIGGTKEQIERQNFRSLESWQRSGMLAAADEALASGLERKIEVYTVSSFGKAVWMSCLFTPFLHEGEQFLLAIVNDVTERKRTEAALQENEKRFRALIENSTDAISLIDAKGNVLFESPSYEHVMGHKMNSRIGRNILDLIHPDDRKRVTHLLDKILRKPGRMNLPPVRVRHADGEWLWIEGVANNLIAEPAVGAIVVNFRDITERMRAEEELRESEERYRGLVEQALMGIGISQGNRVLFANDALLKIFGYDDLEEFKRVPLLDHVAPPSRELVLAQNKTLSEGKQASSEFEYDIRRKNGEIRSLQTFVNRRVIEGKVYYLTVFQDITERKLAEKTLRESEERFRRMFQYSAAGMVLVGTDSRFLQANRAFCDMLGYSEAELLTKTFRDVTHPDDIATGDDLVRKVLAGDLEEFQFEKRYLRKDETQVWGLVNSTLIRDVQGRPLHFVTQIQDITERKRAEKELRTLSLRNEAILASVPDIIMEVDTRKFYTWANRAGIEFFGNDVIGKEAASFFEGEQDTYDRVRSLFSGDEDTVYLESWQRRKDGEKRLLAWWCRVLKNEQGKVTGALSTARDITESKRAEDALRESESVLKASQRVARVGHFVWDVKADAWTGSETLDEILGIGKRYRRTLQGWLRTVHPDDRENVKDRFSAENLRKRKMLDLEYRVRNARDERMRWVHVLGKIESDAAGNPVRMFGTVQDVTERKNAEERIKTELGEKQTLLREIHHRVKNNLQVISSMLTLQSQRIADPEVKSAFQSCRNRVHSIGLVHERLFRTDRFSQIDFGEYARSVLSELKHVYDAGHRISIEILMKSISLDLETAVPCGLILNELATNALKYAFPARRKGVIRIGLRPARGRFLRLSVSDNGVGIRRRKGRAQKEGFGMELVRILSEQIEGKLEITNDRGTTCTVTFPLHGQDAPAASN